MSNDRYALIGEADQLQVSPVDEWDIKPSIDTTRYPVPDSAETLQLGPLAVGHWSYSVRFENYPPVPSVDLAWLYSYLPPPSVTHADGDRAATIGQHDDLLADAPFVDQTRWLYPEGLDALGPGRPCAWDTALDVDWVFYPPPPSIDLRYFECYAPPDSIGGEQNRGARPLGTDQLLLDDLAVGGEDFVHPEGLDALGMGEVCVQRELRSPWWPIYPPPPSIDLPFTGCYVAPDSVSYGVVYDREAIGSGFESLELGPVRIAWTEYADVEGTDQSGWSRWCVTRPYASIWLTYPPVPPVELTFRCSYRPPRATPSYGEIRISALYRIDPLTEAQAVYLSAFDQQGISWGHRVEPGAYIPPQAAEVVSADTLQDGGLWAYHFETLAEPQGFNALGLDAPTAANLNRRVHKGEHETLETGPLTVDLWERYVAAPGLDAGKIDPSGHLVELADSIAVVGNTSVFEYGPFEIAFAEPFIPKGFDSLEVEPIGKDPIFPHVTHWWQNARPWSVDPPSLSFPTLGFDQSTTPLWAYMTLIDPPRVVRHMEVGVFSFGAQTQFGPPTVISAEWVRFGLDPEQTAPGPILVRNFDQETWIEGAAQFDTHVHIVATDHYIAFSSFELTLPQTQTDTFRVANVNRSVSPQTTLMLEASYDTTVERSLAANVSDAETLQVGLQWVSHWERSLGQWGIDTLLVPSWIDVKNNARVLGPAGVSSLATNLPEMVQWVRSFQLYPTEVQTQTGAPTMGWERSLGVRREWVPQTTYGLAHVAGWEQTATPEPVTLTQFSAGLDVVERVNRIRPQAHEQLGLSEPTIHNQDREIRHRGKDQSEWDVQQVELWVRELGPESVSPPVVERPVMIWARPVTLRFGDTPPHTRYGTRDDGLRAENETPGWPSIDRVIRVIEWNESGEDITTPMAQFANPAVARDQIEVNEASTFQFGPITVDGGIGIFDTAVSTQLHAPAVSHFHRRVAPEWPEMEDQDKELIGEPVMSPAYLFVCSPKYPLTNSVNDGCGPNGRDPVPSLPEISSTKHIIRVHSRSSGEQGQTDFPATGRPTVTSQVWAADVQFASMLGVGDPTILPHDQWAFVEDHASLVTGAVELAGTVAPVVDQFIGVGDISQTQIGAFLVEHQHRAILVTGTDQTQHPTQQHPPLLDVDFEKRVHPFQFEATDPGTPWASTDPQYAPMEPGHDSFSPYSDYRKEMKVRFDQQLMGPIGKDSLEWGLPRLRYAAPINEGCTRV